MNSMMLSLLIVMEKRGRDRRGKTEKCRVSRNMVSLAPGKIGRDRKGETKGQNEQQHGISLVLGEMVGNRNGKIERAE